MPTSIALPPQLTIRLVKWSDLAWLPAGLVLLIAGGVAIAVRGQFAEVVALGPLGGIAIAIGLIATGIGLFWAWRASQAMNVQFGDEIQLARLFGSRVRVPWDEVAEVSFHRSERQYEQHSTDGMWLVPIPGVGALTVTSVSTKTRWLVERYVELIGPNGRPIVRIGRGATDELRFTLWYERHQLRQIIQSLNGRIEWSAQGLSHVSLAGTNVGDAVFVPIKQRLIRIRELQAIDLSRTKVTATALDGLEECESLASVECGQTQIPQSARDDLGRKLASRRANTGFGFLQPQRNAQ
ncbi:MAG TPA: hypothetical protein VFV87_19060 [Pirellulaceae bacterium]|nr:hypothetical protein [Pirellulaceae bacterium]